MKRIIIALSLILLICFSFVSCGTEDLNVLSGDTSIKYKIEDGEATVVTVPNKTAVVNIVIPDEYEGVPVTKIADFAAVNLEYAVKVTIGKNVREISDWAFGNSRKIVEFDVDENNPYICDVDGILYSKDMKTLLFYPPSGGPVETTTDADGNETRVSSYTIPEGVETIRTKAFYKCYDLTEITLPSTLKSIEEKAFFRCSLNEITLPDNLSFIGKDAFSYCYNIKQVTIPETVTQIDEYAFYNCTSLLKVTMQNKEENITLGKKWFPTDNGRDLSSLEIIWPE
jgi:hypothetical protein